MKNKFCFSLYLPVTICSSGGFFSFFLKTKSPNARERARLPKTNYYFVIVKRFGYIALIASLLKNKPNLIKNVSN